MSGTAKIDSYVQVSVPACAPSFIQVPSLMHSSLVHPIKKLLLPQTPAHAGQTALEKVEV
jgi:hypothetical protein